MKSNHRRQRGYFDNASRLVDQLEFKNLVSIIGVSDLIVPYTICQNSISTETEAADVFDKSDLAMRQDFRVMARNFVDSVPNIAGRTEVMHQTSVSIEPAIDPAINPVEDWISLTPVAESVDYNSRNLHPHHTPSETNPSNLSQTKGSTAIPNAVTLNPTILEREINHAVSDGGGQFQEQLPIVFSSPDSGDFLIAVEVAQNIPATSTAKATDKAIPEKVTARSLPGQNGWRANSPPSAMTASGGSTHAVLTYTSGVYQQTFSTAGNTAAHDLIGGEYVVTASDSNNSLIDYVDFTFPPSIGYQTYDQNTGFHNVALSGTVSLNNESDHGDPVTASAYWTQYPGQYTISITIHYLNNLPSSSASLTVSVAKPTGAITKVGTSPTPSMVYDQATAKWQLQSGSLFDQQSAAMGWQASMVASSLQGAASGGSYGVVQTMNPFTVTRTGKDGVVHSSGVSRTSPTTPRPLLDDLNSTSPYYHNTVQSIQGNGANTFFNQFDSPGQPVSSTSDTSYSYSATFTQTLMFTPSSGIAVPLGKLTWSITMSATSSTTAPSGFVAHGSPATAGSYSATTDFPVWQESWLHITNVNGPWVP